MRGFAFLLLAVAGGVAGGLLSGMLRDDVPDRPARAASTIPAEERFDTAARWALLEERIAALESGAPSREPEAAPAADQPFAAGSEPPESGAEERVATPAEAARALRTLLDELVAVPATPNETGRLWGYLARNNEQIEPTITRLALEIEKDPNNPELRVLLASALTAKLQYKTQPGPQQGAVWGAAAQQLDKAIELEPQHWNARYSKAFGTTFIPAQFGQRPAAIKQFEQLIAIQEQRAPESHYVGSYYQLGRLYAEAGNQDKAREIWSRGVKLFPDNEQLRASLDVSNK